QQEIARQPLNRSTLETAGRELSATIDTLESDYTTALDLAIAADMRQWYLQTLVQELRTKINDLNTQLLPAAKEVANATSDLADIEMRIRHLIKREPE